MAFAPHGRTAVTVGVDGAVNVWDVTDRARPAHLAHLTNPRGTVKEVRPLASNGTLLTVTAHYSVQIWYTDLEPGARRRLRPHPDHHRPRRMGPPLARPRLHPAVPTPRVRPARRK
ncbi:hypothetical protein AB0L56_20755 [Streptomyces sp. NPDC052079]|uniref:hypothetical protein n=1 Tax=Streptomyces sp. NPDC052079 TaxID=3155526 RepID=UPI00342C1C16